MTFSLDDEVSRERERLDALGRYDILDTPPEEAFDRITRLATRVLDAPLAAVSFIDGERQWFKSRAGLDASQLVRGTHFCSYAIGESGALIVPDATADPRFRDHGLVIGAPHVRSYAGAPLRTGRHGLGTLSVMDTRTRVFSPAEVATLTDLAGLVMTVLDLRLHAAVDALTGVLSRRGFRIAADRLIGSALRRNQELGCVMVDIDHFKRINDGFGHAAGDQVLRTIAEVSRAELRASDVIGRLGGEEFVVLLPQADEARALRLAERLRARIEALEVVVAGFPVRVSASFGVANLARPLDRLDTLLARADAALYVAKREGRNRSAVWRPEAVSGLLESTLSRVA